MLSPITWDRLTIDYAFRIKNDDFYSSQRPRNAVKRSTVPNQIYAYEKAGPY